MIELETEEVFTCPPEIEALTAGSCVIDRTPGPGTDPNCSDPAYAAAHPELCGGNPPRLILKPALATVCNLQAIQFKTFIIENGLETEITVGPIYRSNNQGVLLVSGSTGSATGVGVGIASVSVEWQNMTAQSQVTVLAACCETVTVASLIVLDNSKSMGQQFSTAYATKLTYAKLLARRYASEIAVQKGDRVGVMEFNKATTILEGLTDDLTEVDMSIAGIGQSTMPTSIEDSLSDAIAYLNTQTGFTRKIIILLTDGEARPAGQADPLPAAEAFKSGGGVIIAVGIRSSGAGYDLLNKMATGGFFINAHENTEAVSFNYLSGLKGYVCAGNCQPPGGECVHYYKLNYNNFAKWDVVEGVVDLIGGTPPYGKYDLLPGNGLLVDLVGSTAPWNGYIRTTNAIPLLAGNQYELSYLLAGNQREEALGYTVRVRAEAFPSNLVDTIVTIDDWLQGLTSYVNTFTPSASTSVKISFQQTAHPGPSPSFGTLLDIVRLKNLTTGQTVFFEDWNDENTVCLPPTCGPDVPDPDPMPEGSHDIISIDFKGGEDPQSTKTGAAAIGQAGDFWNTYRGSTVNPQAFGASANLLWADQRAVGTITGTGFAQTIITDMNFGWQSAMDQAHSDVMMQRYLISPDYTPEANLLDCQTAAVGNDPARGCKFFTISPLPTGLYDFYLYGHGGMDIENSRFALSVNGRLESPAETQEGLGFQGDWEEGQQYVRFRDIMVTFGEVVFVWVLPPVNNSIQIMHGNCAGIQIHQLMAPSPQPAPALSPDYGYTGCYGKGCLDQGLPAQVADPSPLPDLEAS